MIYDKSIIILHSDPSERKHRIQCYNMLATYMQKQYTKQRMIRCNPFNVIS